MCLSKKSLVYFDIKRRKIYKFKKISNDYNFGCQSCKMSRGAKCDKTLSNPIKTGQSIYFRINALCRDINGGKIFNKRYIVV